jgi:hypothetical protein
MLINQEEIFTTTFYGADDTRMGDFPGILPIPLYKGMKVTVHSYSGSFEVVDWDFHLGHPDETAGLRIHLKKA